MNKKKAFSYIRMSTETQLRGYSLDRQLTLTKAYANEKGFQLIEDLRDIGLSAHDGSNVGKGQLGLFLKAIDEKKIESDSVLIVESLDRLSRKSPMEAFVQLNKIISYGVEVHTIFDRAIYSAESMKTNPSLLFSSIGYMLRAFSESEEKSKRLKLSWKNKRENLDGNKILTSICPGWLTVNAKKNGFKKDTNRCKTIKKIFDLYIDENLGAYSIAKYLNKNIKAYPKFITPNNKNRILASGMTSGWQKSYIIKILNNPAVYGEFQPYKTVEGKRVATEDSFDKYFPEVITRDRFLLAQAKKNNSDNKSGGRKGDKFSNIFTKLVFCGSCGGRVHFINKGLPPKGGKYLRCSNAEFSNNCTCPNWPYKDFEESFFNFVTEIDFIKALKANTKDSLENTLSKEKISLTEEKRIKSKKYESLLNLQDSLDEKAKKRMISSLNKISEELDVLERRQNEIEQQLTNCKLANNKNSYIELTNFIKEIRETKTQEQVIQIRRKLNSTICQIVEKIILHNQKQYFNPWDDIEDMVSPLVMRELYKQGYNTKEKILSFLNTSKGNYLLSEMNKSFTVFFNNGNKKEIYPYPNKSLTYDNRKFLEFTKKIKEKDQEEKTNLSKPIKKLDIRK